MSEQTERLWLTADKSEIVADGDPDAAFLLAVPGRPIPPDYADTPRRGAGEKPVDPSATSKQRATKPRKKAAAKAD